MQCEVIKDNLTVMYRVVWDVNFVFSQYSIFIQSFLLDLVLCRI